MTQDEFSSWKQMKETQEVIKYFVDNAEAVVEKLSDRLWAATNTDVVYPSIRDNAFLVFVRKLVDLDYEDLKEAYGYDMEEKLK